MNKLKELRNKVRKNNKGFSLVELIVVIVILAILIGVTIGGIYQYVNKSRVNTDINNAASIQSVIATVATDAEVNKNLERGKNVTITWSAADKAITTDDAQGDASAEAKSAVATKVSELLTDGLPAPKANGTFTIEIAKKNDDAGTITATCKVVDSEGNELQSETSKDAQTGQGQGH